MSFMFDVLVIGDDIPSLCAAAAGAQRGAVAMLTPSRSSFDPVSIPAIPNFVWRRLELQEMGVSLEPASALATLLPDDAIESRAALDETADAWRAHAPEAADLWPSFVEAAGRLAEGGLFSAPKGEGGAVLARMKSLAGRVDIGEQTGDAASMIDDFFSDRKIAAHLRAHGLARGGLGGGEAGSVAAIAPVFGEYAWPVRPSGGVAAFRKKLAQLCERRGVHNLAGKLSAIRPDGARANAVFIGDEKIRVRRIFFADPEMAAAAGYRPRGFYLAAPNAARAHIRLSLRATPPLPAGDGSARFQIVDGGDDLCDARGCVLAGDIPERLPLEFELDKGGLVASSAYIPARLFDEEGWREWTGQDRQRLLRVIVDRLADRLPGLRDQIVKQELTLVFDTDEEDLFAHARDVWMQPDSAGAIAAAVKLIDEAFDHD